MGFVRSLFHSNKNWDTGIRVAQPVSQFYEAMICQSIQSVQFIVSLTCGLQNHGDVQTGVRIVSVTVALSGIMELPINAGMNGIKIW